MPAGSSGGSACGASVGVWVLCRLAGTHRRDDRRRSPAHVGFAPVRLKQALRETPDSVFGMTVIILRMARNLHEGFHELFPPMEKPIKSHKTHQDQLKEFRQGH